jgi:excisionase family DNA binding protein
MSDYPDIPNTTLMTFQEAAAVFRLSKKHGARTVQRWIDEGIISVETVVKGKGRRIVTSSFVNWLESERAS